MWRNYLKVALRHLFRQKGYTFINVAGLAVGTACCLLILLYVRHERQYDRFHEKAERIYRIAWIGEPPQTRTPHPMALALVHDHPEVESATSLSPIWGPGLTRPVIPVAYEDQRFDERGFFSADSTFFEVFSFPLVRGDPQRALKEPGGLLITETMARKYFGTEDPLGRVMRVNDEVDLTVTGVLADLPETSHFHFDFLVSYVTLKPREEGSYYTWADFGHYNYIVLADGADPKALEAKLTEWSSRYIDWPASLQPGLREGRFRFALQPLTDIHLQSHLKWELEPNGYLAYVYTFSAAALFILLIACVNFMNLATARAMERAREVGVRKTLGAQRTQLAWQFLGEAALMSGLAMVGAVILVAVLLPAYNELTGMALQVDAGPGTLVAILVGGTLGVGLLAGAYPALVLSGFRPVQVLKGAFKASPAGHALRRGLVVVQFALSILLVIGTLVVYRQLDFMRRADLGFEAEQVLVLPIRGETMRARHEALKEALRGHPGVLQAAAVSNVPGGSFNQNPIQWPGSDRDVAATELRVDYDFLETLGVELARGRMFSREHPADLEESLLINEAAARQFAWADPVGEELIWYIDDHTMRGRVIGVVNDFHYRSLHEEVAPLVMAIQPWAFNYLLVRVQPEGFEETLALIGQTWTTFAPEHAFTYSFLDRDVEALYGAEQQMGRVLGAFAGLALLIAALGLFGLATFAAEQRRKEIGVRRVLGASAGSVMLHLSKDFVRLVLVAFVVAVPVAYLGLASWLGDFPYRIALYRQADLFLAAGLAALAVALTTIGYRTFQAARTNPVEALRGE